MIGCVLIIAKPDQESQVFIRHLINEGSSQRIIGRNITRTCKIVRVGKNVLEISSIDATITLKDYDLHCYVPYEVFCLGVKMSRSEIFVEQARLILRLLMYAHRKKQNALLKTFINMYVDTQIFQI